MTLADQLLCIFNSIFLCVCVSWRSDSLLVQSVRNLKGRNCGILLWILPFVCCNFIYQGLNFCMYDTFKKQLVLGKDLVSPALLYLWLSQSIPFDDECWWNLASSAFWNIDEQKWRNCGFYRGFCSLLGISFIEVCILVFMILSSLLVLERMLAYLHFWIEMLPTLFLSQVLPIDTIWRRMMMKSGGGFTSIFIILSGFLWFYAPFKLKSCTPPIQITLHLQVPQRTNVSWCAGKE